jgi:Protein of unknown function (DUF1205)
MRVLFTVSSWPTHYLSMVPLGWALQTSGHEVRVLCAPSQVDPLTRVGLLAVPVLDGVDVAVQNRLDYYHEAVEGRWPYPWLPTHPLTGQPMSTLDDFDLAGYRRSVLPSLAARAARGFDRAVHVARWWEPEIVVHDPYSLEGLLAARVTGVPAALSLWGPIGTHEPEGPGLVPGDISDSFRRYGLGPFRPDLVDHVIDPCPASIAPAVTATRLPVRYVPCNMGGSLPAWARRPALRPRVCVTWSTALTTMSGPRSYALPDIIRGLSALNVELVVTATQADVAALGEVPPSVRVLTHCPLHLLLPACDAVVHHGGAGSTMTAVCAGVPQLALTFASEQVRNSARIAAAGAGRHLPGNLVTAGTIRDAMVDLLTTRSYRQAAAALRTQATRRPTPAELVETLDKLARG